MRKQGEGVGFGNPALLATVAVLLIAMASAAHADRYRYVVAESHYGNGTISGAIRPWRNGWQVRLPRGTWVDCVYGCANTLRRATIDFWDAEGAAQGRPGSPGYFRWEFSY
jgi:hypothetical protein